MKAIGITQFLEKSFDTFEIEGDWLESFGHLEKNFKMSVTGESGGGKTELVVQFVKSLCKNFNVKADYFSHEQGHSKSLQSAIQRNNMVDVKGKVMFIKDASFDEVVERLKRRASAKIVVIDSQDYCNLTTAQYKLLVKLFPRKAIIVISWAKNDKPKNQASKDIEYMSDIKIFVKDGKAYPRSRFGGGKMFLIFDKKDNSIQQKLF
jgi:Ni2+-binding GTPase involved in maturation of urease and hydrogenase